MTNKGAPLFDKTIPTAFNAAGSEDLRPSSLSKYAPATPPTDTTSPFAQYGAPGDDDDGSPEAYA